MDAATSRPARTTASQVRENAVRTACEKRGLSGPDVVILDLGLDNAVAALTPFLGAGLVGVACCNDDVALAVTAATLTLGAKVPDDIAAVGVDGTPVGQLRSPRLTGVVVDQEPGSRAMLEGLSAALTFTPRSEI